MAADSANVQSGLASEEDAAPVPVEAAAGQVDDGAHSDRELSAGTSAPRTRDMKPESEEASFARSSKLATGSKFATGNVDAAQLEAKAGATRPGRGSDINGSEADGIERGTARVVSSAFSGPPSSSLKEGHVEGPASSKAAKRRAGRRRPQSDSDSDSDSGRSRSSSGSSSAGNSRSEGGDSDEDSSRSDSDSNDSASDSGNSRKSRSSSGQESGSNSGSESRSSSESESENDSVDALSNADGSKPRKRPRVSRSSKHGVRNLKRSARSVDQDSNERGEEGEEEEEEEEEDNGDDRGDEDDDEDDDEGTGGMKRKRSGSSNGKSQQWRTKNGKGPASAGLGRQRAEATNEVQPVRGRTAATILPVLPNKAAPTGKIKFEETDFPTKLLSGYLGIQNMPVYPPHWRRLSKAVTMHALNQPPPLPLELRPDVGAKELTRPGIPGTIQRGMHVTRLFRGMRNGVKARVKEVKSDGSVTVEYSDGEEEHVVEPELLKPFTSADKSAKVQNDIEDEIDTLRDVQAVLLNRCFNETTSVFELEAWLTNPSVTVPHEKSLYYMNKTGCVVPWDELPLPTRRAATMEYDSLTPFDKAEYIELRRSLVARRLLYASSSQRVPHRVMQILTDILYSAKVFTFYGTKIMPPTRDMEQHPLYSGRNLFRAMSQLKALDAQQSRGGSDALARRFSRLDPSTRGWFDRLAKFMRSINLPRNVSVKQPGLNYRFDHIRRARLHVLKMAIEALQLATKAQMRLHRVQASAQNKEHKYIGWLYGTALVRPMLPGLAGHICENGRTSERLQGVRNIADVRNVDSVKNTRHVA